MSAFKRLTIALCIIVLATLAITFYYFVNPETSKFVPKCVMYSLTGYKCPSCGIQRFIHHFIHGEFLVAIKYNYFLILALPYVSIAIIAELLSLTKRFKNVAKKSMQYIYHTRVLQAYLVITLLWWLIRNIFIS